MLTHHIDSILSEFRSCFSYKAAFYWFLIVVFGFIIRCDHHGVTSFIRWLFLSPQYYDTMLRFFRANSWDLDTLLGRWVKIAIARCPVIKVNGRALLIGDGIKVCKEAKKMPAVKPLHQDSDNSGKAEFILGHHIGYVSLLIGRLGKLFCLPLHGRIHEGICSLRTEEGFGGQPATIITRMAYLVVQTAKQTGILCYVCLDAYFSVGPAFLILQAAVNENGEQWVHLITRAKKNYVAYFEGEAIHLMDSFNDLELFEEIELTIYGKTKNIQYLYMDLFWTPVNGLLRFVCIKDGDGCYVLMCSDLQLSPIEIITIYSYRSKIEVMFLFLKHILGGFCYHFWTKACPKLKRGEKIDYSNLSEEALNKLNITIEAIERFVNLAGIALGIFQYLSLNYASQIWKKYNGWYRTRSSEFPSEEVVQRVVQAEFFSFIGSCKVPVCRTLRLILNRGHIPPLDMAA